MKQLLKFWQLPSRDRQILINAFILLVLVRLGLLFLPFQRLHQLLTRISHVKPKSHILASPTIDNIVKAVNISTRYMPGGSKCLARAFTTQVLMSRWGYIPQLKIGVTKGEQGQLKAHAWVESQGRVVIGNLSNLSDFIAFPSLEVSTVSKTF